MSTSLSPRSPGSSVHPTRQQLDELDALLQRMLDLPVSRSEEAPSPPDPPPLARPPKLPRSYSTAESASPPVDPVATTDPEVRSEAVGPGVVAEERDVAPESESADKEAGEWVPFQSSWQPSPLTWQPLQENWKQIQETLRQREQEQASSGVPSAAESRAPAWGAPLPGMTPESATSPPPLPERVHESSAPREDAAAEETLGREWWAYPLVGFNAIFDLVLLPLGPLGKGLKGRGGRKLLGAVGLLCLAAAVGLAVADWIGWTW